ncbi:MAG: DUF4249 domain-containing protein [Bacteroidales bacterium]|nr:DUF4249 domain-containing protein [Bacteroidales bacterium]
MRFKFNILVLVFILGFISCEKKIAWDIPETEFNTIVVDALLTNEYKFQEVRLSLPRNDINDTTPPATGATVSVSDGIDSLNFTESAEHSGLYISEEKITAIIDKEYYLTVEYESEIYEAETYLVPVYTSNRLYYAPVEGSDILYEIKWIAPEYSTYEQAMYEIIIDWSYLVGGNPEDTVTRAKIFHYTLNTVDVSYTIFPQDKEKVYFPQYSIIIERKYSLTDEHAAYIRALIAETEWQGSLFEEARGNLPTNISNGGLGFFAASSMIADTMVVQ